MSNEPKPTSGEPAEDPFGGKGYIVDPLTGERILSPERARLIDEDLERRKLVREKRANKKNSS